MSVESALADYLAAKGRNDKASKALGEALIDAMGINDNFVRCERVLVPLGDTACQQWYLVTFVCCHRKAGPVSAVRVPTIDEARRGIRLQPED